MSLSVPNRAYVVSQLVSTLREAILHEEWTERLPAERALCRLFLVSRMTLRAALSILQKDGLIVVQHGKPTRIVDRKVSANLQKGEFRVSVVVNSETEAGPADKDLHNILFFHLAKANIPTDFINVSDRTLKYGQHDLRNWLKTPHHRVWLLISPAQRTQQWFLEHAPKDTLLFGSNYPNIPLPSVDLEQRSLGRHAAGILLGRGHRRIAMFGVDILEQLGYQAGKEETEG